MDCWQREDPAHDNVEKAILLKRDPEDRSILNQLSAEEASRYIEAVDFCNPHMLVKDERKSNLRRNFFKELFNSLEEIYIVNTVNPLNQTHKAIREVLGL